MALRIVLYISVKSFGIAPARESVSAAEHDGHISVAVECINTGEAASCVVLGAGLAAQEIADVTEYGIGRPQIPSSAFFKAPDGLVLGSPAVPDFREGVCICCEYSKLLSCSIVSVSVQTMRIAEMCSGQSQLIRLGVHHVDESPFGAADSFSNSSSCVIG